MAKEITREYLIAKMERLAEDIRQLFRDGNYWNSLHPGEEIEIDPGGVMSHNLKETERALEQLRALPPTEGCGQPSLEEAAAKIHEQYVRMPWFQAVGVGSTSVIVYVNKFASQARRVVAEDEWGVPVEVRNVGKIRAR